MTKIKAINKVIMVAILLLAGSQVLAQEEQALNPAERKQLTVVTEPTTLYKGFFRVSNFFVYSFVDRYFGKEGDIVRIEGSYGRIWSNNLEFQYGISDRLQIALSFPYVNSKLFVASRFEAPEANLYEDIKQEGAGTGIGDLELTGAYQLIDPGAGDRYLTLSTTLKLPTGRTEPKDDTDDPVGSGYASIYLKLRYDKIVYPYRYAFFASYTKKFSYEEENDTGNIDEFQAGDVIAFDMRFDMLLNDWLSWRNLLTYSHVGPEKMNGEDILYPLVDILDNTGGNTLQYTTGFFYQVKRTRFGQFLLLPVSGKNSGADVGVAFVIEYVF